MIIMATSQLNFPPFDTSEQSSLSQRWSRYVQKFSNFLTAMNISDKKRQRAMLLHFAGDSVYEIFETLPDNGEDYATAIAKLNLYFNPKKNVEYETFVFRNAKQNHGESLDQFHTRLRQLASTCEFGDVDREVKTQLICSCTSSKLRRQGLQDSGITLEQLLDRGRAVETSERQAKGIEASDPEPSANALRTPSRHRPRQYEKSRDKRQASHKGNERETGHESGQSCFNCGNSYPHPGGMKSCPAQGKRCSSCGKDNHYSRLCLSSGSGSEKKVPRGKPRHRRQRHHASALDDPESDSGPESDFTFTLGACVAVNQRKTPSTTVTVQGSKINFMVDTGASVNILPQRVYKQYASSLPPLQHSTLDVFPYAAKKSLNVMGKFEAPVKSRDKSCTATFYVVSGGNTPLLCYTTSCELGLVTITCAMDTHGDLSQQFPKVFSGIGKLNDVKVTLHIDSDVKPVAQPHRRIPFHIRKQVEEELKHLEDMDIIEKVHGPTPWVSPIVVAPKPKQPPKAMTLDDVNEATKSDVAIQKVITAIRQNDWQNYKDDVTIQPYYRVRQELTVTDDNNALLRGTKLVLPTTLREKSVTLAHSGHQGIVKTKQLIREKIWFPGIDKHVEDAVKHCIPCQAAVPDNRRQPLQMTELPPAPWISVAADFCGPLPTGEYLLVIIDEYSRFPDVTVLRSTSAKCVIPHFDRVFANYGIPKKVKTDNGPPFNSGDFAEFAKRLGFRHQRITPLWPQANATAERFMSPLQKSIRTATAAGQPWRQEMNTFLRSYRATPHSTTQTSPAKLMLGRDMKITLPQLTMTQTDDELLRHTDATAKAAMKSRADVNPSDVTLMVGDVVLIRQKKIVDSLFPRPLHGHRGERHYGHCPQRRPQSHTERVTFQNMPRKREGRRTGPSRVRLR